MNERGLSGGGSTSRARAGMQKGCCLKGSEGPLGRKVSWVWARLASPSPASLPGDASPKVYVSAFESLFFPPSGDPGGGCEGVRSCGREGLKLALGFL